MFGNEVFYRRDLNLYPNPAIDEVFIEIPDGQRGIVYVIDINGKQVLNPIEVYSTKEKEINLSSLQNGTYSIEFIPEDLTKRLIWNNKIVVIK